MRVDIYTVTYSLNPRDFIRTEVYLNKVDAQNVYDATVAELTYRHGVGQLRDAGSKFKSVTWWNEDHPGEEYRTAFAQFEEK